MSAIELFTYRDAEVRTVVRDGEPWFVAADVCAVLEIGNPSDALRRLDDDERTLVSIDGPNGRPVNLVNEPGLYSLILGSRKPEAKAFKRWITHEVLPQIRRTGSYEGQVRDLAKLTEHEQLLALAAGLIEADRRAAEANDRASVSEAALESAAPAIAYVDRYVSADDVMTVKAWAAQFGLTDPQARDLLVSRNIIYRQSIGERWSREKQRVVEEFEYRARAGRATFTWFDLRPQHNAPRHHNGQVRQTLYVRQQFALQLAAKVGLSAPSTQVAVVDPESRAS